MDVLRSSLVPVYVQKTGVCFEPLPLETAAFTAEPSEQVPDPIVPNDVISCLFAARGVIAEFVNVLHAKRTGDFVRHNRSTQPVRSCSAEDLWLHDGVNTVICGRNCCNPGTSVWF